MPHTSSVELPRILAAATRRVLVRAGPRGVTYRAVAAEAGVTVRSIQNRFGSLDVLLDYVALRAFQELEEHIMGGADRPLTEIGSPGETLAEALARYRTWAIANPELHRLMFDGPASGLQPSALTKRAAVVQLALSGLDVGLRPRVPPSDRCASATTRPPLEGR